MDKCFWAQGEDHVLRQIYASRSMQADAKRTYDVWATMGNHWQPWATCFDPFDSANSLTQKTCESFAKSSKSFFTLRPAVVLRVRRPVMTCARLIVGEEKDLKFYTAWIAWIAWFKSKSDCTELYWVSRLCDKCISEETHVFIMKRVKRVEKSDQVSRVSSPKQIQFQDVIAPQRVSGERNGRMRLPMQPMDDWQ